MLGIFVSGAFEEPFGYDGGGFVFASDIDSAGGAQFDVGIDEGERDASFEEGGVDAGGDFADFGAIHGNFHAGGGESFAIHADALEFLGGAVFAGGVDEF